MSNHDIKTPDQSLALAGLTRYEFLECESGCRPFMGELSDGEFVKFNDVNRLLAAQSGSVKLDDTDLYHQQMAGISCAAFGHWKEGDSIHPDYDTVTLRDVAKLYAKYEAAEKALAALAAGTA